MLTPVLVVHAASRNPCANFMKVPTVPLKKIEGAGKNATFSALWLPTAAL